MYYFIYRPRKQPNKSGVVPPPMPNTDFGLGTVRGWYIGRSKDLSLLYKLSDFNLIPVPPDIGEGIKLVDVERITVNDPTKLEPSYRDLTPDELALKKKAEAFMASLDVRSQVDIDFQTLPDSVADLYKRVVLLERFALALADKVLNNVDLPANQISYMNKVKKSIGTDIVDVYPLPPDKLTDKILSRAAKISSILKNYYNQVKKL